MDGERGYNSSHCIGSLRVIGTLPALYPFPSVSLSPDSLLLLLPTLRCLPSYLILRRPRARVIMRVMPLPHHSISPLRPTASHLPVFCSSASIATPSHLPTNRSFHLSITYFLYTKLQSITHIVHFLQSSSMVTGRQI